jgi:hypothetical protein
MELLQAVADGLEQPAGQLADALAAQVLEALLVRAALLVHAGGPLSKPVDRDAVAAAAVRVVSENDNAASGG